jgi:hypothetical protein
MEFHHSLKKLAFLKKSEAKNFLKHPPKSEMKQEKRSSMSNSFNKCKLFLKARQRTYPSTLQNRR